MVQQAPNSLEFPNEDEMGEHERQTNIRELLRPLLQRYLREKNILAHVGSDQFIYWDSSNPKECLSPDMYLLLVSQLTLNTLAGKSGNTAALFLLWRLGLLTAPRFTKTTKSFRKSADAWACRNSFSLTPLPKKTLRVDVPGRCIAETPLESCRKCLAWAKPRCIPRYLAAGLPL
jgi:hypothetical protein